MMYLVKQETNNKKNGALITLGAPFFVGQWAEIGSKWQLTMHKTCHFARFLRKMSVKMTIFRAKSEKS